jgi:hypothetical protein
MSEQPGRNQPSTRRAHPALPPVASPRHPGPPDRRLSSARLRVFVCNFCSTAEVVPWCGQNPDCGHPECTEALARYAAPHQLDGRRFHGQVNVIMIDRHLWDRYDKAAGEAT